MATNFKACLIAGCNANAHGIAQGRKGYCRSHYTRLRQYGDPLGGRASPGDLMMFIEDVALKYSGEDCLAWPFGILNGYGQLKDNGKLTYAHRLVCERIHGAPPTSEHEATHNCGNAICINPSHLEWKTHAGNCADKLIHDTHNRGERHNMAKLTEDDVLKILALKGVKTQNEIARQFGVTRANVSGIHRRRYWAWLTAEQPTP